VLQVERISVYYKDVQALRDVSLSVSEGKIVALLGPNAAGKSTTSGPSARSTRRARAGSFGRGPKFRIIIPTKSYIGYHSSPGRTGLFSTLTVRENLELGAYTAQARRYLKEI